jgi:hypothetical protein
MQRMEYEWWLGMDGNERGTDVVAYVVCFAYPSPKPKVVSPI